MSLPEDYDPMKDGLRCKTCGHISQSWNSLEAQVGIVATELTMEHFHAIKRLADHQAHMEIADYEVVR